MLDRNFKMAGISITIEQWRILAMLSEYNGESISKITQCLSLNISSVSRQLKSLEMLDLVYIQTDVHNKKQKNIFLTEKGRLYNIQCCEQGAKVIGDVTKGMPQEQTELFIAVIENYIKNAEAYIANPLP